MKRSELKRHTPLKRTGFKSSGGGQLKRTPINRRSSHNKERAAEAKPVRDAIIAIHGECWICKTNPKRAFHPIEELNRLCCHEVASGQARQRALDEPSCLMVLCWMCNGETVEDRSVWPLVRQLAMIQAKNPSGYDLARFNEIVGYGPNRIEQWEVDEWAIEM